jgi:hypothetical protein
VKKGVVMIADDVVAHQRLKVHGVLYAVLTIA